MASEHIRAVRVLPPSALARRGGPRYLPGQVAWLPEREAAEAVAKGWAEPVLPAVETQLPLPVATTALDEPPSDKMLRLPKVKK